jgi:hypothetical protein
LLGVGVAADTAKERQVVVALVGCLRILLPSWLALLLL